MIERINQESIGKKVKEALNQFLHNDFELLQINANERTLTHRVALYLQNLFPNFHVDCEYNRDDHEPKDMQLPGGQPDQYDTHAQTVYPDIIIHHRRTTENILVMEFKKTSSKVTDEKDFIKLHAYKQQLGYQHAIFVEFEVGQQSQGISRFEWV